MSTSSIFEASLLFCVVRWALNVTSSLPNCTHAKTEQRFYKMKFFIFKIGTRQIGHRLHCVAQCKQAQTWEQRKKTALF